MAERWPSADHIAIMCCRVIVEPVGPDAIDLLLLAGFRPAEGTDRAWVKTLEDGVVRALRDSDTMEFTLQPTIATMEHHAAVRQAGAVMFKVAARLAEISRGTMTHASNIGACAAERHSGTAVIATYPAKPLRYENLCLGFRTVFGTEAREAA